MLRALTAAFGVLLAGLIAGLVRFRAVIVVLVLRLHAWLLRLRALRTLLAFVGATGLRARMLVAGMLSHVGSFR